MNTLSSQQQQQQKIDVTTKLFHTKKIRRFQKFSCVYEAFSMFVHYFKMCFSFVFLPFFHASKSGNLESVHTIQIQSISNRTHIIHGLASELRWSDLLVYAQWTQLNRFYFGTCSTRYAFSFSFPNGIFLIGIGNEPHFIFSIHERINNTFSLTCRFHFAKQRQQQKNNIEFHIFKNTKTEISRKHTHTQTNKQNIRRTGGGLENWRMAVVKTIQTDADFDGFSRPQFFWRLHTTENKRNN